MNKLRVIGYEMWRAMNTKKYGYIFVGLCLFGYRHLYSSAADGVSGTPPWSVLTYAHFLASLNVFLLPLLILLCIPVFDAREQAARRILFSTPISSRDYHLFKAAAAAAVFAVTSGMLILGSALFYAIEFRFFAFTTFLTPIMLFLFSPALLLLGVCFALGHWSVKALYLLLPVVWFTGMTMLQLPPWLDLIGDDYLSWHGKLTLIRSLQNADSPAFLQPNLLWSRVGFVLIGTSLLAWSCRHTRGGSMKMRDVAETAGRNG